MQQECEVWCRKNRCVPEDFVIGFEGLRFSERLPRMLRFVVYLFLLSADSRSCYLCDENNSLLDDWLSDSNRSSITRSAVAGPMVTIPSQNHFLALADERERQTDRWSLV
ncbi:hypothetical protein CC2G_008056 [Coprinopsis cinerea AmutBmut pab1-1]|nr:hypothetical protein CC2G_008056 [Coprinopsis cinerea AmutBmut pab1-1]